MTLFTHTLAERPWTNRGLTKLRSLRSNCKLRLKVQINYGLDYSLDRRTVYHQQSGLHLFLLPYRRDQGLFGGPGAGGILHADRVFFFLLSFFWTSILPLQKMPASKSSFKLALNHMWRFPHFPYFSKNGRYAVFYTSICFKDWNCRANVILAYQHSNSHNKRRLPHWHSRPLNKVTSIKGQQWGCTHDS